jgi:hypothetical protein
MIKLVCGILLLMLAYWMLRIARPQPDGEAVRFLARESLATGYALLITASIGLGISLAVAGLAGFF